MTDAMWRQLRFIAGGGSGVTDSFPNFSLTVDHDFEETPWNKMTDAEQEAMTERQESFGELPVNEQWGQAFDALKKRAALDLIAEDWKVRLDRAFPLAEVA